MSGNRLHAGGVKSAMDNLRAYDIARAERDAKAGKPCTCLSNSRDGKDHATWCPDNYRSAHQLNERP